MKNSHSVLALTAALLCAMPFAQLQAQDAPKKAALADLPPMGWNSWDSYGTTITEEQFKQNADWMALHLKQFGWQYAVVDMEWFVTNPTAEGSAKDEQRVMDAFGRYTPALNRFPSAAGDQGFAPLATYVHSLGLKFGIHILQGIPREAAEKNLPIYNSELHVADAANTTGTCRWNQDNYDLKPTLAGQAYYDSIARLYAEWGVDLVKVDCIAAGPFKEDEIRMMREALNKTGRPIVLSLSPGEPPFEKADVMQQYAQQWRISNDIWDIWHSTSSYPQGLGDQFQRAAKWKTTQLSGHWPDADMLPLGHLGPAPGWGKPRDTRLTHDEQRTLFNLWAIFRSPLMMGGDLPSTDAWTLSLLTNPEVLAVDQHSRNGRAIIQNDKESVWTAQDESARNWYVAIFNLKDEPQQFRFTWADLGLADGKYRVRDLWQHKNEGTPRGLTLTLDAHASILLQLSPRQ